MDWIYGQIVGFLGNFFALMGNMGVELFELDWVNAIVLFFSRLGWALFAVSVVVCAFECGIEYSAGRGNLQQCALNVIKGFLAVSLFTVVPVRLYALSVSLQGTFSAGLTGYGRSIGEVGQDIVTELSEIQTLSDAVNSTHFGLDVITSPIMILFCVILMAYAVLKVFFANLKRGGILLIQIAVGSLYILLVFCDDNNGNYHCGYTVGSQAKTIMDDEAIAILADYLDRYYNDYSISEEEIFSKSFEDTGERIMTVTKSPAGTIAVCGTIVIAVALVFVALKKRGEQKEKERRQMEDILKTPLEKFGDQDVEDLAKKYEQDGKSE